MVDGNETERLDDTELIRRAIGGESSAFGILYNRYRPKIYRFIYLKVSHREEAEDLTHHVFLSAWKNLPSFRPQGLPITSWLYRIARNRVIDHYRTRKRLVSLDSVPEEVLGIAESDTSQSLINRMELERVWKVLGSLSQDQQDVLILRFVEDLSYPQIAEVVGKSQGAVRVIQHRALKAIRDLLSTQQS
jgi:RNA polymerase sigma-70 factor (ECF subfamily)